MTNGVVNGVATRRASLSEEQQIRELLPRRVKTYVMERMNVPVPWAWLWNYTQKNGEKATLEKLHKVNCELHVQAHGHEFYRALSPYRASIRP